jgi:hypothetical protein
MMFEGAVDDFSALFVDASSALSGRIRKQCVNREVDDFH